MATINGGQGNDVISQTGAFASIISGDDGADTLSGAAGVGGAAAASDTIYGGAGADRINGGTADIIGDTLVGGDGIDIFGNGNATNNSAGSAFASAGGALGVTALLTANQALSAAGANAYDVITDFTAGVGGDAIDLSTNNATLVTTAIGGAAIAANTTYAVSGTYTATTGVFALAASNTTGPDTLIFTSAAATAGGQYYVLQGVNASTLTTANFV